MKPLRYIAFFLLADLLFFVLPIFYSLYFELMRWMPYWLQVVLCIATFKSIIIVFVKLIMAVCKVSPNPKIVFRAFVVILIIQTVLTVVISSSEILDLLSKKQLIFFITSIIVSTAIILVTAYGYVKDNEKGLEYSKSLNENL